MNSKFTDYIKIYGGLFLLIVFLGVAVKLKNEHAEYEESKDKFVLYDIIQIGDDKEPSEFYVYRNVDDGSFEFESVDDASFEFESVEVE